MTRPAGWLQKPADQVRSGQEVLGISRDGTGLDGTVRVGSGRVGSGGFQILRVGPGRVGPGYPDTIRLVYWY